MLTTPPPPSWHKSLMPAPQCCKCAVKHLWLLGNRLVLDPALEQIKLFQHGQIGTGGRRGWWEGIMKVGRGLFWAGGKSELTELHPSLVLPCAGYNSGNSVCLSQCKLGLCPKLFYNELAIIYLYPWDISQCCVQSQTIGLHWHWLAVDLQTITFLSPTWSAGSWTSNNLYVVFCWASPLLCGTEKNSL